MMTLKASGTDWCSTLRKLIRRNVRDMDAYKGCVYTRGHKRALFTFNTFTAPLKNYTTKP